MSDNEDLNQDQDVVEEEVENQQSDDVAVDETEQTVEDRLDSVNEDTKDEPKAPEDPYAKLDLALSYTMPATEDINDFLDDCEIYDDEVRDAITQELTTIWSKGQYLGLPLRKLDDGEWQLTLNYCGLDQVPSCVQQLQAIKRLDCVGNNIKEIPNWLQNQPQLTELVLCANPLQRLDPWLKDSYNLTKLYLLGCDTDLLPEPFVATTDGEITFKMGVYYQRYAKLEQLRLLCISNRLEAIRFQRANPDVQDTRKEICLSTDKDDDLLEAAICVPPFLWATIGQFVRA